MNSHVDAVNFVMSGGNIFPNAGDKPDLRVVIHAPEMFQALKNLYLKLESASPELRRMVNYNEIEQALIKAGLEI